MSKISYVNTNTHESNPGGGILGEIDAYYGTVEESGRGALHLHMLLWLANNKDPHELRQLILDEVRNVLHIKFTYYCFKKNVLLF